MATMQPRRQYHDHTPKLIDLLEIVRRRAPALILDDLVLDPLPFDAYLAVDRPIRCSAAQSARCRAWVLRRLIVFCNGWVTCHSHRSLQNQHRRVVHPHAAYLALVRDQRLEVGDVGDAE